ncbi:hypothetical protein [Nocardia sp. NPDC127526]|uniref:hypothetical protein n=1 Tax=Nocardia sp. NPDC127526 TaxID=3345393 RepID=UPI00362DF7A3
MSTTPEPPVVAPAPSPADYIPDPPVAPPNRPRPQQQTQPNIDTLVTPQTPDSGESEPEVVEPQVPGPNAPSVMPTDPHQLRVGTNKIQLPDFVDEKTRNKAQAYLDMAEWQIAAMYDGLGFPREQSDRMAAGSVAGSAIGGGIGIAGTALFGLGGCVIGGVVGVLAGAAIAGIPTAGAGAPIGAAIGGGAGCLVGGTIGALPGFAVGATVGALAGGAFGGLSGVIPQQAPPDPATVNAALPIGQQPAVAPLSAPIPSVSAQEVAAPIINAVAPVAEAIAPGVDVAAPIAQAVEPVAAAVAPVVEQVSTAVDQFSQNVEQAVHDATTQVNSLGAALANMPAMPALTPEDFLAAVQAAPPA